MPRYFANAKYPEAKSLPALANDGLLQKTTGGDTQRALSPFLTERMFVRRAYFGQFEKLYFVLNWLVMRCKLRPEHAADAQQTA